LGLEFSRKKPLEGSVLTKVLVIDDDDAMTDLVKMVLEPKSFEVYTVNSGPEGIQATLQIDPDIIILDLLMPDMDGWEVCKKIREFSHTPILVLSVINKPGMVERALDEGADDYLIKPVPSGSLIARLNTLLRRARAEQEAANSSNGDKKT
jgi:DNA-binding response OmpR family regulator